MPIFYRYVMMVDELERVKQRAQRCGVMCERPVYRPLHDYFPSIECPNSDYAYERALSVPLYPSLTEEEVEYTVKTLEDIFEGRSF
jgi:perosamine synthetase